MYGIEQLLALAYRRHFPEMDSERLKEVTQRLSSLFRRQMELLRDHPAIAQWPDDRAREYEAITQEIRKLREELDQL